MSWTSCPVVLVREHRPREVSLSLPTTTTTHWSQGRLMTQFKRAREEKEEAERGHGTNRGIIRAPFWPAVSSTLHVLFLPLGSYFRTQFPTPSAPSPSPQLSSRVTDKLFVWRFVKRNESDWVGDLGMKIKSTGTGIHNIWGATVCARVVYTPRV